MTVPLTWVISEQFNRRDFKAMAFFVLLFKRNFSKGLDVFAIKASDDTSIKNAKISLTATLLYLLIF